MTIFVLICDMKAFIIIIIIVITNIFIYLYHVIYFSLNFCWTLLLIFSYSMTQT